MDKKEISEILAVYISSVKETFDVKKAFLFGSWAKGKSSKYSDIDVAIVLDDFADYFDTQVNLMYLTRGIDSRIEPHPFKISEFNRIDPLAYEILKDGIEIDINQQPKAVDMVAETQASYTTKQ